jgi:hypothetical protein
MPTLPSTSSSGHAPEADAPPGPGSTSSSRRRCLRAPSSADDVAAVGALVAQARSGRCGTAELRVLARGQAAVDLQTRPACRGRRLQDWSCARRCADDVPAVVQHQGDFAGRGGQMRGPRRDLGLLAGALPRHLEDRQLAVPGLGRHVRSMAWMIGKQRRRAGRPTAWREVRISSALASLMTCCAVVGASPRRSSSRHATAPKCQPILMCSTPIWKRPSSPAAAQRSPASRSRHSAAFTGSAKATMISSPMVFRVSPDRPLARSSLQQVDAQRQVGARDARRRTARTAGCCPTRRHTARRAVSGICPWAVSPQV